MTMYWEQFWRRKIKPQIQLAGVGGGFGSIWRNVRPLCLRLPEAWKTLILSALLIFKGRLAGSGSRSLLTRETVPLSSLTLLSLWSADWHQFIHLRHTKAKVFTWQASSRNLCPNKWLPFVLVWMLSTDHFHRFITMSQVALQDFKYPCSTTES